MLPALFALEVALIAGIFWADAEGYVPLSKTPFLLAVAWGSMRLRRVRWRDVGLELPPHWRRLAAIGVEISSCRSSRTASAIRSTLR